MARHPISPGFGFAALKELPEAKEVAKPGAAKTAPPAAAPETADEAETTMVIQGLRLHPDMIKAVKRAAKRERRKYAEYVRELISIGMRQKGITYD